VGVILGLILGFVDAVETFDPFSTLSEDEWKYFGSILHRSCVSCTPCMSERQHSTDLDRMIFRSEFHCPLSKDIAWVRDIIAPVGTSMTPVPPSKYGISRR
jgi:hypothetical protein